MLNIELTSYGVDDTIKEMKENLESVLGRAHSKKHKDEVIYQTIGALNALYNLVQIIEAADIEGVKK